jgi:hypothetical protein
MTQDIVWVSLKEAHEIVDGFIRAECSFYYDIIVHKIKEQCEEMFITHHAIEREKTLGAKGFATKKSQKQKQYEALLVLQKAQFHKMLRNIVEKTHTVLASSDFVVDTLLKHDEIDAIPSNKRAGMPANVIEQSARFRKPLCLPASLLPLDAGINLPLQ